MSRVQPADPALALSSWEAFSPISYYISRVPSAMLPTKSSICWDQIGPSSIRIRIRVHSYIVKLSLCSQSSPELRMTSNKYTYDTSSDGSSAISFELLKNCGTAHARIIVPKRSFNFNPTQNAFKVAALFIQSWMENCYRKPHAAASACWTQLIIFHRANRQHHSSKPPCRPTPLCSPAACYTTAAFQQRSPASIATAALQQAPSLTDSSDMTDDYRWVTWFMIGRKEQ